MSRLLRANIARLWKSRAFWICFAAAAADGLTRFFSAYCGSRECVERLGGMLVSGGTNVMFIASIFTALYLGTEYSNGTLRNKLILGHKRTSVYFANLVTVLAGTFIYAAAEWLITLAAGMITGGSLGMETEEFLMCAAVYVCSLAALCAVNTLIGIIIASKSCAVVTTLALIFGTIIISVTLMQLLSIPKVAEHLETAETGTVRLAISSEVNPLYIDGTRRQVYTFLNNVLPCGPMCWLENGALPEGGETLPMYSIGVFAVSTAVGVPVFRRKDLK